MFSHVSLDAVTHGMSCNLYRCLHFVYVDASSYSIAEGENGYSTRGTEREPTQMFPDQDTCKELGTTNMAHLNSEQVSPS